MAAVVKTAASVLHAAVHSREDRGRSREDCGRSGEENFGDAARTESRSQGPAGVRTRPLERGSRGLRPETSRSRVARAAGTLVKTMARVVKAAANSCVRHG